MLRRATYDLTELPPTPEELAAFAHDSAPGDTAYAKVLDRLLASPRFGERAVDGVIDTHDLHATILHLLGLDHELLTYRYAGREFRLTNVSGKVARQIMA